MKPTKRPCDSPAKLAIQSDSYPLLQTFEALLARYKARMYELYGNEICGMGQEDGFTFPEGVGPSFPINDEAD